MCVCGGGGGGGGGEGRMLCVLVGHDNYSPLISLPPVRKNKIDLTILLSLSKNKMLGRARDPRANGAWLNKQTE